MQYNFIEVAAVTALIPLLLGYIWYHPKVFGTAWLKACGYEDKKLKEGLNMWLLFTFTYVFGFFISIPLTAIVIHQMGFSSMLQTHMKEPAVMKIFGDMMATYGNDFRTFKHGALHGTISGLGIALPIIAITALFERRGWKYIAINTGYWVLCLILMGGILCQFVDLTSFAG